MAQREGRLMIGFTGSAADRADHLRLDAEAIAELMLHPRSRLLLLSGLDPILEERGLLSWSSLDGGEGAELIFLGFDDGAPLFAPLARVAPGGPRAWGVFSLIEAMAPGQAALWGTARSLIEWHNRHLFCSACGSPSAAYRAGWGRKCLACRTEHFPRVDPVVIMLAEHEGRVLVGRGAHYPPGRYSALAGFVEPGESIEEAVARELQEEAGIRVGSVRYVASQPWPFPGSLMIACIAKAESDALTLDANELEHAFWATRSEVEAALGRGGDAPFQAPPDFAIAHTLLARWLDAAA